MIIHDLLQYVNYQVLNLSHLGFYLQHQNTNHVHYLLILLYHGIIHMDLAVLVKNQLNLENQQSTNKQQFHNAVVCAFFSFVLFLTFMFISFFLLFFLFFLFFYFFIFYFLFWDFYVKNGHDQFCSFKTKYTSYVDFFIHNCKLD